VGIPQASYYLYYFQVPSVFQLCGIPENGATLFMHVVHVKFGEVVLNSGHFCKLPHKTACSEVQRGLKCFLSAHEGFEVVIN